MALSDSEYWNLTPEQQWRYDQGQPILSSNPNEWSESDQYSKAGSSFQAVASGDQQRIDAAQNLNPAMASLVKPIVNPTKPRPKPMPNTPAPILAAPEKQRPGGVIQRPGGGTAAALPAPPAKYPSIYNNKEMVDEAEHRRQMDMQRLRKEREEDLKLGRARGEEIFTEGSLGRVREDITPEMQAVLDQRLAMTKGFTPEEIEAQRSIYLNPAQQALQGQLRGMRSAQANAGVRGATASAQEGQIRTQFANKQAQLSQAQALADTEARRQALTGYQQALQGSEADRLNREQFNIAAKNRELLGVLNTELGYGSLGVADRGYLNQGNLAAMFGAATMGGGMGGATSPYPTGNVGGNPMQFQLGGQNVSESDWWSGVWNDATSGGDRIAGQMGGFASDSGNWLNNAASDSASWLGTAAGDVGNYFNQGMSKLGSSISSAFDW